MCCEATDALLEFVRRYLGLTGLRNLNAPRRLKLRVPVLKEWLQRQGQGQLAASIPDWDPVRRPTGRWKSWEMANLKPIMDEKAVERQAKRQLVGGENAKDAIVKHEAANRNEAAAALVGLVAPIGGDGEGGDIDECGADGGAEEEEEEEELPEDAEMVRTSEEGACMQCGRARVLLLRPSLRGRNFGRARAPDARCVSGRADPQTSRRGNPRRSALRDSRLPCSPLARCPPNHSRCATRRSFRSHFSCTPPHHARHQLCA